MPTHPILLATTDVALDEACIEKMNSDLMDQMGAESFCAAGEMIALTRSTGFEFYDKPDNLPEFRTTIICHPATPYYASGYARGYWPDLVAMIEFLNRRIPDSSIWYGDDSSGLVDEVTDAFLDHMWNYWSRRGGRDYYKRGTLS